MLSTSRYAPLPRRRLYWNPSDDVSNAALSHNMTTNRFEELISFIQITDNNSLPPGDKMAKVRSLFTELNTRFATFFIVRRSLSIHESMVTYYGKHSEKQFIHREPILFGYKVWSINSPYGCVQMDPCQGAGVINIKLGLRGSVVVSLAKALSPATD